MFLVLRYVFLTSIVLLATTLRASTSEAWRALLANDNETAITLFNRATMADAGDWKSWLGRAYAQEILGRTDSAWSAYRQAILTAPSSDALVFAALYESLFDTGLRNGNGGREILEQMATERREIGILSAMASMRLGKYELSKGRISEAKSWFDRIGFIKAWRVIGPFNNVSGSGFDKVYPPETEDRPDATYRGANGALVQWTSLKETGHTGWIDMKQYYTSVAGVFYASTYIYADREQRVHARLGTSGAFRLYLNGTEVHSTVEEHNNDLDTYITAVTLPKGWSHVLVKLCTYDITSSNFLLRFTTEQGESIRDLEVTTTPKSITRTSTNPVLVGQPILDALRADVAANADDVIPAILLAKGLLRNDQAIEAELVLRPVVDQYPTSVLVLQLYREALIRGDKMDEAKAAYETMLDERPDLPSAISSKLEEVLEQGDLQAADSLVAALGQRLPGSLSYYRAALQPSARRNDVVAIRRLIDVGAATYPEDLGFTIAAARLASMGTRRLDSAIGIINRHLQHSYSQEGLSILAEYHKQSGDIDNYERTLLDALNLSPTASIFHVNMAVARAERSEYDVAIRHLKQAAEIAPSVADLWKALGDIYRTTTDLAQARSCFERALSIDPADFDARERIRQLKGDPAPFSLLPLANVDSLIAASAAFEEAADVDAVVLYRSQQRVVYDGSRSELREEVVMKITSIDGIDTYKEYTAWSGDEDGLSFEKSVVRKPNGREVPADRDGGFLVFKTLAVGDVIHVRFRVRQASYGRMAQYFSEDVFLDDDVPVRMSSYHLIVPTHETFRWVASNWDVQPTKTSTLYGDHYVWTLQDAPPIKPEIGMPAFRDVARRLQLSTMQWSDIVDWYHDISRTKARKTFEIAELMDSLAPRTASLDDDEIIRRVYDYVTTNVRYSAVSFRQSGIIPQQSRKTLITRIGDCKDVSTLCIAMLAERDIPAHIVLVNTTISPNAAEPLPSTDFDHAIVRIKRKSTPLFMDLTAPDIPMGCLPGGDVGAFALMIDPGTTAPARLLRSMFPPSNATVRVTMSLNGDTATMRFRQTHSGSAVAYLRTSFKRETDEEITKDWTESLTYEFPDVQLSQFVHNADEPSTDALSFGYDATAPRHVIHAGDFRIVKIPWYSDYTPDASLSAEQRTYPIEREPNLDTVRESIIIDMPEGYEPSGLSRSFVREHPTATVRVNTSVNGRTLQIDRVSVLRSAYIKPSDYTAYRTFYNDVVEHDRRYLLLVPMGTVVKPPSKPAKR
jgi:tetratricopeptide (TPR) repeat protein